MRLDETGDGRQLAIELAHPRFKTLPSGAWTGRVAGVRRVGAQFAESDPGKAEHRQRDKARYDEWAPDILDRADQTHASDQEQHGQLQRGRR